MLEHLWHSTLSDIYHSSRHCSVGNNVERRYYAEGSGGRSKCGECSRLEDGGLSPDVHAICLSGGGAKGDFHLGVLQYLYREVGLVPSVLSGTSVGALMCLKLAEGADSDSASRALGELESSWLSLQTNRDLYAEQPWFQAAGVQLRSFMAGVAKILPRSDFERAQIWLNPLAKVFEILMAGVDCLQFADAAQKAFHESSVYRLTPMEARLRGVWSAWSRLGDPGDKGRTLQAVANADGRLEAFAVGTAEDFWHCWQESPGGQWSAWSRLGDPGDKGRTLQAVANADGRLEAFAVSNYDQVLHTEQVGGSTNWSPWRRIGEVADRLTNIMPVVPPTGSVAFAIGTAGDFWQSVRRVDFNVDEVRESGVELRLSVVQLESGALRCINQDGHFVDAPTEPAVRLADAALASASIPVAFPPVALNGKLYVDGGVREIVPIAPAIAAGANIVIAINCSPPIGTVGVRPTIEEIASRSFELALDEVFLGDIAVPDANLYGRTFVLIQPRVAVHDLLTIDPGLIDMQIAYGYMEAADTLIPDIQHQIDYQAQLDDIIRRRMKIWELEHYANGERLAGEEVIGLRPTRDGGALLQVRQLKRELRDRVQERSNHSALPPHASDWWNGWERHPWLPFTQSPWDAFLTSSGTVVPADRP